MEEGISFLVCDFLASILYLLSSVEPYACPLGRTITKVRKVDTLYVHDMVWVFLYRNEKNLGYIPQPRAIKERFRPMPLCSPILLPTPHALVRCSYLLSFLFHVIHLLIYFFPSSVEINTLLWSHHFDAFILESKFVNHKGHYNKVKWTSCR